MDAEVTIRPARPDDRPDMERICADTWEGGDYIPEVWDEWLADPGGGLTVGEMGGEVIAVSKATYQTAGQVWLEGMRVAPQHRRKGIASRFLDYNLAEARKRGACVVRLGTSSRNTPVHKMVVRVGMERVGSYVLWVAQSLLNGPQPAILTETHAGAVQDFVRNSPVLAHTQRLYCVHWAWQELSPERVAEFLAAGQVADQLDGEGALTALAAIHRDADDTELWIGFADGQPEAVGALALALRGHADRIGAEQVRIMLPGLPWLRTAFAAAGYGPGDWDGELWIFEIRLDQSQRLVQSQEGYHDR